MQSQSQEMRVCDGPEEEFHSSRKGFVKDTFDVGLKEMMQGHHDILLTMLDRQQAVLDDLQRWTREVRQPPGLRIGRPGARRDGTVSAQPSLKGSEKSMEQPPPATDVPEEGPAKTPRLATQIQARTAKVKQGAKGVSAGQKLRSFVSEGPLDLLAGIVILINTAVLILEQEIRGDAAGRWLDALLAGSPTPSMERPAVLAILEYAFLVFYVFECLLRIAVLRRDWFYTAAAGFMWGNYLDGLIVLFGVADVVIAVLINGDAEEATFTVLLVRLVRLVKVVKTLRLVRVMQLFVQLRGMVDTFLASLMALLGSPMVPLCLLRLFGIWVPDQSSEHQTRVPPFGMVSGLPRLFWSMIMLLVCMSIGALVLCEACMPLLQEMSLQTAEWVFGKYGTFFRSMFTMFEITFSGGWPSSVRPLVDDVSIYFAVPCLLYVVFIVFAALRLITALLVRSTMQAMSNDAAMAVLERQQRSSELQSNSIPLWEILCFKFLFM